MPRVLFSISYRIKPEHREQYLTYVRELKQHISQVRKKNYSVFETRGKANHFTEVFTTESMEDFDALDDNQDERTEDLVSKVEECVDQDGMKYQTLVEAV